MTRRLLAALAATVLLAGCAQRTGAGVPAAPSSPPSPSPAPVTVSVVRTGSLVGVNDRITVDPAGAWTATDRTSRRRTGQLTDAQRDALQRLAADPRLRAEAARVPPRTNCADVLDYALTVNTMRISFSDCPTDTDPPQAARAIVDLVTRAVAA